MLHGLTADERYIRSYYLDYNPGRFAQLTSEAPMLLPSVIFAAVAELNDSIGPLWVAFFYLLGLYLWRIASSRWTIATASLLAKYEDSVSAGGGELAATPLIPPTGL